MTDAADLDAMIAREAIASVRALAAAERAVAEGRLNIAKVLRAAALSARQRALVLERVASAETPPIHALAMIADGNLETVKALTLAIHPSERAALAGATAADDLRPDDTELACTPRRAGARRRAVPLRVRGVRVDR